MWTPSKTSSQILPWNCKTTSSDELFAANCARHEKVPEWYTVGYVIVNPLRGSYDTTSLRLTCVEPFHRVTLLFGWFTRQGMVNGTYCLVRIINRTGDERCGAKRLSSSAKTQQMAFIEFKTDYWNSSNAHDTIGLKRVSTFRKCRRFYLLKKCLKSRPHDPHQHRFKHLNI